MRSLWSRFLDISGASWPEGLQNPPFYLALGAIALVLLAALAGHCSSIRSHVNPEVPGLHQELQAERNERQRLQSVAQDLLEQNIDLQQLLDAAGETKETVRYVQQVRTVLVPQDPVVVLRELPDEYLFKLNNQLVVGSFRSLPEGLEFRTYEVGISTTVVIGATGSSAVTKVVSSYDGATVEVPTDLLVLDVQKRRLLDPRLSLGLAASTDLQVYPYVSVDFLSISRDLRALGLGLGAGPRVQLEILRLNVGRPLPLVDNLWVGLGLNHGLVPSGQLSISSNL